jgi:hypothetical protein
MAHELLFVHLSITFVLSSRTNVVLTRDKPVVVRLEHVQVHCHGKGGAADDVGRPGRMHVVLETLESVVQLRSELNWYSYSVSQIYFCLFNSLSR